MEMFYPLPMEAHTTTEGISEERRREQEEIKGEDPGKRKRETKKLKK